MTAHQALHEECVWGSLQKEIKLFTPTDPDSKALSIVHTIYQAISSICGGYLLSRVTLTRILTAIPDYPPFCSLLSLWCALIFVPVVWSILHILHSDVYSVCLVSSAQRISWAQMCCHTYQYSIANDMTKSCSIVWTYHNLSIR